MIDRSRVAVVVRRRKDHDVAWCERSIVLSPQRHRDEPCGTRYRREVASREPSGQPGKGTDDVKIEAQRSNPRAKSAGRRSRRRDGEVAGVRKELGREERLAAIQAKIREILGLAGA
jgi:hypothetical protein